MKEAWRPSEMPRHTPTPSPHDTEDLDALHDLPAGEGSAADEDLDLEEAGLSEEENAAESAEEEVNEEELEALEEEGPPEEVEGEEVLESLNLPTTRSGCTCARSVRSTS